MAWIKLYQYTVFEVGLGEFSVPCSVSKPQDGVCQQRCHLPLAKYICLEQDQG